MQWGEGVKLQGTSCLSMLEHYPYGQRIAIWFIFRSCIGGLKWLIKNISMSTMKLNYFEKSLCFILESQNSEEAGPLC